MNWYPSQISLTSALWSRIRDGTSVLVALVTDRLREWGVVLSMMRLYVPKVVLGLVVSSAMVRLAILLGEQMSTIFAQFSNFLSKSFVS